MKYSNIKFSSKNKSIILESLKQAKQIMNKGLITQDELDNLMKIHPDPKKTNFKYLGWMIKQWANKTINNIDLLRNTIEEFDVFLTKGKTQIRDINYFKTFEDLQKEVVKLNNIGAKTSRKDLEKDYDIVVNNSTLFIVSPHTHEASRKLGSTYFADRVNTDGSKDCVWCTTYANPSQWNAHYMQEKETLFYIRIRSKELLNLLIKKFGERGKNLESMALIIGPSNKKYMDDMTNSRWTGSSLEKILEIINVDIELV